MRLMRLSPPAPRLGIFERSEIDDEVMDAAALLLISLIEVSREEGSLDWDVIVGAKNGLLKIEKLKKECFLLD